MIEVDTRPGMIRGSKHVEEALRALAPRVLATSSYCGPTLCKTASTTSPMNGISFQRNVRMMAIPARSKTNAGKSAGRSISAKPCADPGKNAALGNQQHQSAGGHEVGYRKWNLKDELGDRRAGKALTQNQRQAHGNDRRHQSADEGNPEGQPQRTQKGRVGEDGGVVLESPIVEADHRKVPQALAQTHQQSAAEQHDNHPERGGKHQRDAEPPPCAANGLFGVRLRRCGAPRSAPHRNRRSYCSRTFSIQPSSKAVTQSPFGSGNAFEASSAAGRVATPRW